MQDQPFRSAVGRRHHLRTNQLFASSFRGRRLKTSSNSIGADGGKPSFLECDWLEYRRYKYMFWKVRPLSLQQRGKAGTASAQLQLSSASDKEILVSIEQNALQLLRFKPV